MVVGSSSKECILILDYSLIPDPMQRFEKLGMVITDDLMNSQEKLEA